MNKNAIIGIVVAIVVVVGGFIGFQYMSIRSEAAKWTGPLAEIDKSEFKKEGSITTARFEAVLEGPLAKVQDAIWKVEDSAGKIESIKLSKLVSSQGNTKVVDMQIQALKLPIQAYTMEFTLSADEHKVSFRTTKSGAQDLAGSYRLVASPDGKRTRLIYESKATDKIAIPFPESVIEGASKETFVQLVRGLKKMLQS